MFELDYAALEAADEGELVDTDPSELAALLYTGGTTGRSKGVMLSHNALSSAAWCLLAAGKEVDEPPTTSTLLPSHVRCCVSVPLFDCANSVMPPVDLVV